MKTEESSEGDWRELTEASAAQVLIVASCFGCTPNYVLSFYYYNKLFPPLSPPCFLHFCKMFFFAIGPLSYIKYIN